MTELGLLLRFLLITSTIQKGLSCQIGWLSYGTRCYRFFSFHKNITEAEDACINVGAVLASLPSDGPLTFLSSQLYFQKEKSFWLGLSAINGSLEWVDGSTVVKADWLEVAPPIANYTQCYALENKKVKEFPCTAAKGYVCERSGDLLTTPGLPCFEGTNRFGSSCFWQIMTLGTHDEASAGCKRKGGHLADLNDKTKIEYAKAVAILRNGTFWLGATKHDDNKWRWTDGTEFRFSHIIGHDSDMSWIDIDVGGCLRLGAYPESQMGIKWFMGRCYAYAYAFCEAVPGVTLPPTTTTTASTTVSTPAVPVCRSGLSWKSHEDSGMCFWETTYEIDKLSWDSAREFCQRYGGDLASYNSKEQEITGLSGAVGHSEGLWIGLRRDLQTNIFKWSDGSTLTYANWAPGQPKLGNTKKLCVAHSGSESKWEVSNCNYRRWFVCKAPKRTEHSEVSPVTEKPIKSCLNEESVSRYSWYYFEGYCYLPMDKRLLSWIQAKTFCEDNGAQLTSINSWEESDFIFKMRQISVYNKKSVWIGLRAIGVHSSYQWIDGSTLNFVNWEEDDIETTKNMEECVSFNSNSGLWEKRHCNTLNGVICKKLNGSKVEFQTKAPAPVLPGFCHSGWYTFENKCYKPFGKKHSERLVWAMAKEKCAELGAVLVSIHSNKEQEFIDILLLEIGVTAWIGMQAEQRENLYHWIDGSPIDYDNWGEGEPRSYGNAEDCVELMFNSIPGKWNDVICNDVKGFICQRPKDETLLTPGPNMQECRKPKGWARLGGSCYKVINYPEKHSNWIQAQTYCKQEGGNLVSIPSLGINIFLKSLLRELQSPLWIGMRDTEKHKYRWLGEWPLSYSNWDNKQPEGVADYSNCAVIGSNGKWSIKDCSEKYPFICEIDTEGVPTLTPLRHSVCPSKQEDWKDLGGSQCYLIVKTESVNWDAAANICYRKGGALASFHSYEELHAISYYIKDAKMPLHIGLGQMNDGSYVWIDGSPVDFVNWAVGEPNGEDELCVEMHTDATTWNDIKCKEKRGYICSINKVAVPTVLIPLENMTAAHRTDIKSRLETGGIIGIVVCVLVVIALFTVAYHYCCQSSKRESMLEPSSP